MRFKALILAKKSRQNNVLLKSEIISAKDVEFLFFDEISELPSQFDWTLYGTVILMPGKVSSVLGPYLKKLTTNAKKQKIHVILKSGNHKTFKKHVKITDTLLWEASDSLPTQISYILQYSAEQWKKQNELDSEINNLREKIWYNPQPVIGCDHKGAIREVNQAFLEIFHYSEENIIGFSIQKIIPDLSIEKLTGSLKSNKENINDLTGYTFLNKEGNILPCYAKILFQKEGNKQSFAIFILDQSEVLTLQRSIEKRNDLIVSLSYLINFLSNSLELNFNNPKLIKLLKSIFSCDFLFINQVKRNSLDGNYEFNIDKSNATEMNLLTKFGEVIYSNLDSDELCVYHPTPLETLTSPKELKIRTLISLPFMIGQSVHGVMNIFYLNYFEPELFYSSFMKLIGKIIALSEVKSLLVRDLPGKMHNPRDIIEHALDGIYQSTPEGRFIYANPALIKMLGYDSLDDLLKLSIGNDLYIDPSNRTTFKAQMDKFGHVNNFFTELVTKNKTKLQVLEQAHLVHTPDTDIYYEGFIRDITQFKKLEEQLKQSKNFADEIIDQANFSIIILDSDRKVIIWNRKAELLTGYSKSEMINQKFFASPLFKQKKINDLSHQHILNEDENPLIIDVKTNSGEDRLLSLTGWMLHSLSQGTTEIWYGTDITDVKRIQESVQETIKMDRLNSILNSLANNFNQILFGIQSEISFFKSTKMDPTVLLKSFERIEKSIDDGIQIKNHIESITSSADLHKSIFNPNSVIEQVVEILERTKPSDIEVLMDLKNNQYIEIDASKFNQVFINLALNAFESMPEGGQLTIQTSSVKSDQERYLKSLVTPADRYVKITFSDTGCGMEKDNLVHALEPFYTTKTDSLIRGLGLTYAYQMVSQHSGFLNLKSEKNIGTSVSIYVPAIHKTKDDTRQSASSIGKGTILVIDDEVIIRELLSDILQSQGYNVLTAENGKIGLELYRSKKAIIDIIILDIIMPEMDGKQVYEKVKSIDSEARVLITSGYSKSKIKEELLAKGVDGFLPKPFDIKDLLKQLENIL